MTLRGLLQVVMIALSVTATAQSGLERRLESMGMVDVSAIDGVHVSLMYACDSNFTGIVLYDSLTHAYLHPDAASALALAADLLQHDAPGMHLLVKDAARPVSVQQIMFDKVRGTPSAAYVSNPRRGGGTHNYGLAVDITLCDSTGHELSMGTPVDYFGSAAHITAEASLAARGIITADELRRRRLLRRIMTAAGFKTISKEWWHYELHRRATAAARYPLIP